MPDAEFAAKAPALLQAVVGGNKLVSAAFAAPPKSMKEVAERYGKLLADVDRQWKEAVATKLIDPDAEALRRVLYGPDSPADAPLALDWGFLSLFPDRATQAEYEKLLRALENWLAKGPPRAMVLHDSPRPYDPRIFDRGHPGRPGEPVPRQFLKIANPNRKPFGDGSGRLDLARAIVSKDNPLTARVFVNRVWMHHFGRGLVGTPSDFGLRGDPPTHPELLDWLAAEFMAEAAGSVKHLHKLIMTSATYTQASLDRADALAVDPENRLLWKQNRRRLEFEPLHDALLAVSGQLDTKLGGPPARLFGEQQPPRGLRLRRSAGVPEPADDVRRAEPGRPHARAHEHDRRPAGAVPDERPVRPRRREAAHRDPRDAEARPTRPTASTLIYLTVYSRKPSADERKLALAFVAKGAEQWIDLAHGLLMTNEFAFVD